MFNTSKYYIGGNTTNNNASVTLNTPSTGFIQKSNPLSRFIRVKNNSKEFERLFPQSFEEKPKITVTKKIHDDYYKDSYGLPLSYDKEIDREVIVLQMMVFGNDEFIVEYIFADEILDKN